MRENVKALVKEYNKTEDDLKALQVPLSRAGSGSAAQYLTWMPFLVVLFV